MSSRRDPPDLKELYRQALTDANACLVLGDALLEAGQRRLGQDVIRDGGRHLFASHRHRRRLGARGLWKRVRLFVFHRDKMIRADLRKLGTRIYKFVSLHGSWSSPNAKILKEYQQLVKEVDAFESLIRPSSQNDAAWQDYDELMEPVREEAFHPQGYSFRYLGSLNMAVQLNMGAAERSGIRIQRAIEIARGE